MYNWMGEFKSDCQLWCQFLNSSRTGIRRPFIDMNVTLDAKILDFYSDAAKRVSLGLGAVYGSHWLFAQWEPGYIEGMNPSIEYLELLAVCMAFFAWSSYLGNKRIVVFCDNRAVVTMINNTTAKCKNCMVLICKLVLRCLLINTRLFCCWVRGKSNCRADYLSCQRIDLFKAITKDAQVDLLPTPLPGELWLASKLWVK